MMRSVAMAVIASTCAVVGVLTVGVAAVAHWMRNRRWNREMEREFPAQEQ